MSDTATDTADGAQATDNGADPTDTNPTTPAPDGALADGEAAPEGEAKPQAEKKPDIDARLIAVSKQNRTLKSEVKAIKAEREQEQAQLRPILEAIEKRKEDPLAFLEFFGIDLDTAIERFADIKKPRTVEDDVEDLKKKLAAKEESEAEARKRNEKEEREQKIGSHINQLKTLAEADKDKYPLTNKRGFYEQAFDVMVVAHNEGTKITYADALDAVEATLQEEAEELATTLGYTKPAKVTAKTTTTLSNNLNGDVAVRPSVIKTDEEIEADFHRLFAARR